VYPFDHDILALLEERFEALLKTFTDGTTVKIDFHYGIVIISGDGGKRPFLIKQRHEFNPMDAIAGTLHLGMLRYSKIPVATTIEVIKQGPADDKPEQVFHVITTFVNNLPQL